MFVSTQSNAYSNTFIYRYFYNFFFFLTRLLVRRVNDLKRGRFCNDLQRASRSSHAYDSIGGTIVKINYINSTVSAANGVRTIYREKSFVIIFLLYETVFDLRTSSGISSCSSEIITESGKQIRRRHDRVDFSSPGFFFFLDYEEKNGQTIPGAGLARLVSTWRARHRRPRELLSSSSIIRFGRPAGASIRRTVLRVQTPPEIYLCRRITVFRNQSKT